MLAPPCFNICLDTVIRELQPELQRLGVTICYKLDGQLMHCKNPTEEELMWIMLYADDISLVRDDAQGSCHNHGCYLPALGAHN